MPEVKRRKYTEEFKAEAVVSCRSRPRARHSIQPARSLVAEENAAETRASLAQEPRHCGACQQEHAHRLGAACPRPGVTGRICRRAQRSRGILQHLHLQNG